MCLINFAYQSHPTYKFILVGNRDEFYERPTQDLNWWKDHPEILAGRDLKDGGTWMGMNKFGSIAALTNYRDVKNIKQNAPSRGIILTKYLSGEMPLDEFHIFLKTQGHFYNGFNLVYGNTEELYYYSNADDRWQILYPGIYGLSNAFLNTAWNKVVHTKKEFEVLIANSNPDREKIISMMQNTEQADDKDLPYTGVPFAIEKQLSSAFINMDNYGTRLTTYISISNLNEVHYLEKRYDPNHETEFKFHIVSEN